MRFGFSAGFLLLGFCLPGYSANIGFQINGSCSAGSCPAQPLPNGGAASLPFSSNVTLANGDQYNVVGSLSTTNSASGGTFSLTYTFEITYLGNGSGGTSQGDTVTVDAFTAFTSSFATGNFSQALTGLFSSNIAASSSAQACAASVCLGPVSPPGNFNAVGGGYSLASSGGAFSFDNTYIAKFGAGSPAGSFIIFSYPALPAPSINSGGILNAASFAVTNGAGAPVAPGSLVAIFTSQLPTTASASSAPFQTTLAGVNIYMNTSQAPIDSVTPIGAYPYVTALVPFEINPGSMSATLLVNGVVATPGQTTVIASAPGIFTIPPTGLANAVLVYLNNNVATIAAPTSASIGYPTAPIPRGTSGFFYATGLGAMTPPVSDGDGGGTVTHTANATPQVFIGGISVPVSFAGQAPGYPGVNQINITVPQNAPTGSAVPLVVKSADGTVTSNTATIAVQ